MKIKSMGFADLLKLEKKLREKKEIFVWVRTKEKNGNTKDEILSSKNENEKKIIEKLLQNAAGINRNKSIEEFGTSKKILENKIKYVKEGKCPYKNK